MTPAAGETLIGIVDVETTGIFPQRHDRVVEVAAVLVDVEGRVMREFASLVNPERDVGPTRIHGLKSADVMDAPTFRDVAPLLVASLEGAVAIAGHNVWFDARFLACEFQRLNQTWPACQLLCTMRAAGGGKLKLCCERYSIPLDGDAHCALIDARATAKLLARLLRDDSRLIEKLSQLSPIRWPVMTPASRAPLTREASRRRQAEPPGYLQRLLEKLPAEPLPAKCGGAALSYVALLDRILEDRCIEDCECEALLEMARHLGMSRNQVRYVHQRYVDRLAMAAVADGVVSDMERQDLYLVCRLLGDPRTNLDAILDQARASLQLHGGPPAGGLSGGVQPGMSVCFSGELACTYCGQPMTRDLAEELASRAGLKVAKTVTKRLDILVVADPHTQSNKAKKAREYAIRIMHEPVFWSAIGVRVQ